MRTRAAWNACAFALVAVAGVVAQDGGGAAAAPARGDLARGVALLERGEAAAAVAELEAALERGDGLPEMHWNLALARWQAGDAEGAERAAEKAATLSDGGLAGLRDALLGNLRYDAARAALAGDAPDPKAALEKARQARDRYLKAASRGVADAPVQRNLERVLRLIESLEQQEDPQQQDQEQKQDSEEQDPQQDQEQKQDSQRQDQEQDQEQKQDSQQQDQEQGQEQKQDSQQQDPQQGQEQKQDSQQQDQEQRQDPQRDRQQQDQDRKQDPQQKDGQPPEPKPDQDRGRSSPPGDASTPPPEQEPPGSRERDPDRGPEANGDPSPPTDAPPPLPGERFEGELSPEQKARLQQLLERLAARKQELREARARAQREKVRRDW